MNDGAGRFPPEQQAIRDKCFHPSGTFVEFPLDDVETSVCARFAKIAARFPSNPAIITDAESLTYAGLNERANRVARGILDQSDSGAEAVALLFKTKLALTIAKLAVLKAGKFLVSLDPAWPEAQLRTILDDVQPKFCLAEEPTAALAAKLSNDRRKWLDIDAVGSSARQNLGCTSSRMVRS